MISFEEYRAQISGNYADGNCPLNDVLFIFQGKWNAKVLFALIREDPLRFKELQRRIPGVTNNMLTVTLKDLEARGFVNRVQYQEMPLRVEYSLTDYAKSLYPIFVAMTEWAVSQQQ